MFRVPTKLVVLWQRGANRRKYSKSFNFQPGIAKPYRGVMVWAEPEELEMICTLYKVRKALPNKISLICTIFSHGIFKITDQLVIACV